MIQVNQEFLRIGLFVWFFYVFLPVIFRVVAEFMPLPIRLLVGPLF
jgi:hypothetical protein